MNYAGGHFERGPTADQERNFKLAARKYQKITGTGVNLDELVAEVVTFFREHYAREGWPVYDRNKGELRQRQWRRITNNPHEELEKHLTLIIENPQFRDLPRSATYRELLRKDRGELQNVYSDILDYAWARAAFEFFPRQ